LNNSLQEFAIKCGVGRRRLRKRRGCEASASSWAVETCTTSGELWFMN